ncbi:hypothetical protein [Paenibacillus larvae]|uniref:Lipoprotein n=1 Tax=Paenibacillus larvae subsp. larvae TaxID=147375 RepID=A0A2L1U420_9BACL|nr:hypothetical protein [Paenibacillus larvae]AQZ46020.1 hypothetical protein B5S25_04770 [Paenibacillus larvae subsp. pulvifaciens]AVF27660.1 hypothetical protein ERICIII_03550 [Paenibacillus larvae subsp. larvae]MBH0341066.1 hypothetical protein [Paenibacillus larvae]MCY7522224.1 hypothetical protein [Paenibacillus larvae]MCY9502940.1 hypothetical protein [Paenibacillus larvae]
MQQAYGIVGIILALTLLSACDSKAASVDMSNPVGRIKEGIKNEAQILIEKHRDTSIKELIVNEHVGVEMPEYSVLVHLSLDKINSSETAKDTIDMYSNDLAANLVNFKNVTEITVFWEVPFLKKGVDIAKAIYQRKGGKMYLKESWYDHSVIN